MRCELLSFFSIFGIQNNLLIMASSIMFVVNCFHFSVSLGYKTTHMGYTRQTVELWIAFIFQYLWDTKQPLYFPSNLSNRCELLSFFSIFGIQNNTSLESKAVSPVVNCFHFSVSLGYKTTLRYIVTIISLLWIAFIFQYLWDTKQLFGDLKNRKTGCELLSFFSIFGIQNNYKTN